MKTAYTFDAVTGLSRMAQEEHNRLWEIFGEDDEVHIDAAVAIGYVQLPVVFGHQGDFLMRLVVNEIPDTHELPHRYLVWIDGRSDDGADIFVPDDLALLELLTRYGPFLTQALGPDAAAGVKRHQARFDKASAALSAALVRYTA